MSNDHTFTIKVTVDVDSAEALERKLSEALGDDPYERQIVLTFEHFRNLGPSCAGSYDKTVEEILQEVAAEFPGTEIEMAWENEFGQEGGDFFQVEAGEDDDREAPAIINREVAERFLEDPDSFDLLHATEITDEGASIIANYNGWLDLSGLMDLSDGAAESLSELDELQLNGLTELSDAVAKSLSKHSGVGLSLNGLTEVSNSVARSLAKQEGSLELNGLTELTDSVAEAFSNHCGPLGLNGIFELSDTAARFLSANLGDLSLNGLSDLSEHAAAHLAASGKGRLPANDIVNIASNNAGFWVRSTYAILKNVFGCLSDFTKLTDVAPLAAAVENRELVSLLAKESNHTEEEIDELLNAIMQETEWSLRHPLNKLDLNGLWELSDAAAESLAKHEGILSLGGLPELSDAAAESLSKVVGSLDLNGLTELSDAVAKSLSKVGGSLSLRGLTELSDAAAESLSKVGGSLSLWGLTELSDAAAESLSKFGGEYLALDGLTELSQEAAKALVEGTANIQTELDLEAIASGDVEEDDDSDDEDWED